MNDPRVTFEPSGREIVTAAGTTILAATRKAGVRLDTPCGGIGACRGCRVVASGNLSPLSEQERKLLAPHEIEGGMRLACITRIEGAVTVDVDRARLKGIRVLDRGDAAAAVRGARTGVGAALDVGTTTVVASIVDLATGDSLARASSLNPQSEFGHDVIARIAHVSAHGHDELTSRIVSECDELLARAAQEAGVGESDVGEIVVAGNAVMLHLFLGIDPLPIGTAPYEAAFLESVRRSGSKTGLSRFGGSKVHVLPSVSAFIGADIVAGMLAVCLEEREGTVLFVDLGTNGEVVLKGPDGLSACSTAAGPALEGASTEAGMQALPGAVERVYEREGDLVLETVGGAPVRGICGSGLIDLIALLLRHEVLDVTGRMAIGIGGALGARVRGGEVRSLLVDEASGVRLTQKDVRQFQLAKAAVSAGAVVLLEEAGIVTDDVGEVLFAGGFGYHLDPDALVVTGLIPPAWRDRVMFVGNSAIEGATVALVDLEARKAADALARRVRTVLLATHPGFQERYVAGMDFPEVVS